MKKLSANEKYTRRSTYQEKEHRFRSKFERDRDRIIYSTEFRRLNKKTQVFVSSFDDNSRNRLTHTIEVAQIAKTISEYFKLDQDLTEAISYGHDIGHTPFGHTGERTLNLFINGCDRVSYLDINDEDIKGFKHNWQSLRVVLNLEKISELYDGLNLTEYSLWGILHHTNRFYENKDDDLSKPVVQFPKIKCDYCSSAYHCAYLQGTRNCKSNGTLSLNFYKPISSHIKDYAWTIEALVVRIADEIAQRHHDIEDAIYARIIDNEELVELFYNEFDKRLLPKEKKKLTIMKNKKSHTNIFIKELTTFIVNFYVTNLIKASEKRLKELAKNYSIRTQKDFHDSKTIILKDIKLAGLLNLISFDHEFNLCDSKVRNFLKHRILNSHLTQTMDGKSNLIIRRITYAYLSNPAQLHDKTIITLFKNYLPTTTFDSETKGKTIKYIAGYYRDKLKGFVNGTVDHKFKVDLQRTICDFIAGMTDSFALREFEKLYGTSELKNY